MSNNYSKKKMFIVKPSVAVPTAASRLYNLTTDQLNQVPGSIGGYTPVVSSSDPLEATGVNTSLLRFIQVRDTQYDTGSLPPRPLEQSEYIDPSCGKVIISGLKQKNGSNHLWIIGPNAISGAIQVPVGPLKKYVLRGSETGNRKDLFNNVHNIPTNVAYYTSPDWTLTTYTTSQQRDITLQSIVKRYNETTQGHSVAFCLNTAGNGNGITLAAAAATPINSIITLGYRTGGVPMTLTMTRDHKATFTTLAAAGLPGTTEIQPYCLPGSTGVPAGTTVAGSLATGGVDNICIISLDRPLAAYDERNEQKTTISVGLDSGFEGVSKAEISRPEEGFGLARHVKIQYQNEEITNQHWKSSKPWQGRYVAYHNEIKDDATYDMFTVDYCNNRSQLGNNNVTVYQSITIYVVSFEDPNTPYYTGAANPQKTYIQSLLNAYNANNNLGNPTLAI